jgi:hypothetical protein
VTSDFGRGVNEIFALLGCYAAFIDSHQRFETPYLSRIQGSSLIAWPLNMGSIGCPETSEADAAE